LLAEDFSLPHPHQPRLLRSSSFARGEGGTTIPFPWIQRHKRTFSPQTASLELGLISAKKEQDFSFSKRMDEAFLCKRADFYMGDPGPFLYVESRYVLCQKKVPLFLIPQSDLG